MLTTYDDIWECFIDNCGVDESTLPQTDEGKYILIKNGAIKYNTTVDKSEAKIKCDEYMEQINLSLDYDRLLILAYCMRYTFLENELIAFEQVWQPFSSDIGQKFYREQIQGRENTLTRTKKEIDRLLDNIDNMSYLN